MHLISIVVPAFNEEAYLGQTLASLSRAQTFLPRHTQAEIIVVDNNSDDSTAEVARALGVTVARETQRNIAKVRNKGASLAKGETIVFIDADTVVPDKLLARIVDTMSDDTCFGGAVDLDYRPMKLLVKAYLEFWRIMGKLTGTVQGATQFYRRDIFLSLKGYDETLFMGEDVDLYWRLKRLAKRQNGRVVFIEDIRVVTSTRRFDQWRLWRTLVWTNPLLVFMFRRSKACWRGWYGSVPR
jgi:glycosyltransferase involved in cell wall biosynthesis